MAKTVLIISSSPRIGGNSDRLCDEFARGAEGAGHVVQRVQLTGKHIAFCDGCNCCSETGECVHQDDMVPILQSMIDSDVIVLATPVYFYTVCAQLKTVIDRCCSKYTQIAGKDFYFIATAAETDEHKLQLTIDTLRGFTDWCLPEPHEKGVIMAGGVWKTGEIESHPAMREAYVMGSGV